MKSIASLMLLFLGIAISAPAQTAPVVLAKDGAWTWYNDPRAIVHNGVLYFGYVKNTDGKTALSALNLQTGARSELWTSEWAQKDDHNNPGLLVKEDGKLLAIYARHNSDQFFSYRLSTTTNPASPASWSQEFTNQTGAGVTYANPFQLASEYGRIYNFTRNQNFNPTVLSSTNGGQTWSAPQLFIKNGTGSVRPYVKYASARTDRIDFLYTDGHPRNVTNSLYHLSYRNGAFYNTAGALVKNYSALPILHDSGERGSVIYQYSDMPTNDPNVHIPTGRAWCWEITYQTNKDPIAVFTVQRDTVAGPDWTDDRIYYYYARWTGTNWQKRFIAHAGRPLYQAEDDYAGGICIDPENANVIYISSNAQNPFDLSTTTNVPLQASARYEIYRGVTTDGGLSFNWQAVTTNSAKDNLRPYVPRGKSSADALIWFRGTYTTFTSYNCEVVGLFSQPLPRSPEARIVSPRETLVAMTNLNNRLRLEATIQDDDIPHPPGVQWSTSVGPTNAVFSDPTKATTYVQFPETGFYTLRVTADDSLATSIAETTILAGPPPGSAPDASRALWLKLDETSGSVATDSSGNNNNATASGGFSWQPSGGVRQGTLRFNGSNGEAIVPDAANLDNAGAFTLAFWFKANAFPLDSAGLVCKRNGVADNNAFTTYLKTSDQRIYVDLDSANNRFASNTSISTGMWYHVAVIFDGSLPSAQRAQLWIDGQLDVIGSESSSTIPNYASSLRLGNTHPNAANWLNGYLDDVQIFRRALTPREIQALAYRHQTPSIVFAPSAPFASGIPGQLTGQVWNGSETASIVPWETISGPAQPLLSSEQSATLSVKFPRGGNYTFRVGAHNTLATVMDETTVAVAANTNVFLDWADHFLFNETDPLRCSASADPDLDGVPNLIEFALGMNPSLNDASPFSSNGLGLPRTEIVAFNGTNFLATTIKSPRGRLGVEYLADVSSDFSDWESQLAEPAVSNADGTQTLTFRDSIPATQGTQRFSRFGIAAKP